MKYILQMSLLMLLVDVTMELIEIDLIVVI